MKKTVGRYLFAFAIVTFFLTGCASQYSPPPVFNPQAVPNGQYDKKVDHLVMVLDASSSMGDGYQGTRNWTLRGVFSKILTRPCRTWT